MDKFTEKQAAPTQEERTNALAKDLSWWEVAALALLDSKDSKAPVAKVAAHPLVQARLKLSANKNLRAVLWASLQSHTKRDCPNVNYAARMDPLLFWKDDNSVWSIDPQAVDKEVPELRKLLDDFKNPVAAPTPIERFKFTTFHQSFSYEDFVEGIKPQTNDSQGEQGAISYDVMPGIFKEICLQAKDNPTKRYAIFIDEINRGNVASIFGELITLIEEDKRLGGPNQLTATLPYSREAFGVPSNLYIIGTMNTADRSVEALDTALRRRFTFEEMRPEADKITQPSNLDVDLHKLFQTINSRIEQLLDRDHCIGHYYLMGVSDLVDLRGAFANKIIPLLREYFYGNPAKVGMVLGERFVSARADRVDFAPGNWGTEDLDEKVVYEFKDVSDFSIQDFVSIYESPRTGI
jgi:5-methylcytosine-specific restriction endonuclease McrBC GTP-binding regulatory subunit McrB